MAAEVAPQPSKKTLSKTLMEMKFMRRKAESDYRRQLEEERQRAIEESHWVLDEKEKDDRSCIEFEPSYVKCEELYPSGRMSFKNFNPTVEKMFKEMLAEENLARSEAREREETVSDEEMAKRYESFVGTVAKKFSTKRKRSSVGASFESDSPSINQPSKKTKREFMKPKDR
ncbi:M-phase phosphoprotein 6-like [Orbicella faveolata]|uniref:M-phase phosphoprotein 6-like n=1 Tax=Orbicella faveolata TaxID=48498 RepID=UPI0009E36DEC|nr:M-phase phosphoprotein 6-like [Orbicella faveolata]